jgi:hypothetical protein
MYNVVAGVAQPSFVLQRMVPRLQMTATTALQDTIGTCVCGGAVWGFGAPSPKHRLYTLL